MAVSGTSLRILNSLDQPIDQAPHEEYEAFRESLGGGRVDAENLADTIREGILDILAPGWESMTQRQRWDALEEAGFYPEELSDCVRWLLVNSSTLPYDDSEAGGEFWDAVERGEFGDDFALTGHR